MEMLNQKQKVMALIIIVIVAGVILYYYINSTKEIYNYNELDNITETDEEVKNNIISEAVEEKIIIHVTGAVELPGIVEVKQNARINDVIEAAGGVTEDANLSDVNLAYKVEDGQKIYIPSKYDEENLEDLEIISSDIDENIAKEYVENNDELLVNINTALLEELIELPGIGSSTANKIIIYRTENGKFNSIEDIKNVPGIGEAKFNEIKDLICI